MNKKFFDRKHVLTAGLCSIPLLSLPMLVQASPASDAARAARLSAARRAEAEQSIAQTVVVVVPGVQVVDTADDNDDAPSASEPVSPPVAIAAVPAEDATATSTAATEGTAPVAAAVDEDEDAPGPPGPAAAGAEAEEAAISPFPANNSNQLGDQDNTTIGTEPLSTTSFVEAGISSHRLTNGFGSWSSVYLRTQYRANEKHLINAEIAKQRQFGDSGTYLSLGDTYVFSPDLYGSLTVGTSTGGFFLPRFRVDAFLNRKLLRARNLVATVGLGYYKARDVYNDRSVYLGATYYFAPKWIVEGGVRFNTSNPGSVGSRSQFVALTQGVEKRRYITLRVGNGRESYQLIGPNAQLVDFASNETSLTIRQWLNETRGVNLVLERYSNPSYQRRGASLGYFQDF
ncbi:MAG TPA: YaiO family outer membrane beta-barrel protein [Abditibacteriaceae bacterium]|jgi:YaiO family outer membrane protein